MSILWDSVFYWKVPWIEVRGSWSLVLSLPLSRNTESWASVSSLVVDWIGGLDDV